LPPKELTLWKTLISAVFLRVLGGTLSLGSLNIAESSALDQRTIGRGYEKNLKESLIFMKEPEKNWQSRVSKNLRESLIFMKEPEKNWQSWVSEKLQRIIGFHERTE
jgi:hypothetical protein